MKKPAEEIRKITVNMPASLIDPMLQATGKGPTELLTELVQKEKNRLAWQGFKELRGKVTFDLTYEQLKELRD
jgi:hypothetical protein